MEARRWLLGKLEAAGVSPRMDGAGNVVGRRGDPEASAVALGSHLDSVPCGGMFDGTLGALAGLECLRVLEENGVETRYPVELIAFSEEEGRFGGMLGSQAVSGQLTPEWLKSAQDPDGVKLEDAMRRQGFDPIGALDAHREPHSFHAFLELHIEQGPVLEKLGKPIGIVEGISGVFVWVVRLIGKPDHSGTAPMDMRSDAFMGLADFAHEIPRIIDEEGTDKSRLTVGKAELKPGVPHTVAGEVVFTLVGRDMTPGAMEQLAVSCRKVLSAIARRHNLMFEYHEMSWLDPHECHPEIVAAFSRNAQRLALETHTLPSGAGHDTQCLTELTRAGMIFVPSVGGVSHAPDEWTHWSDVEKGANLLLHTVLDLAEAHESSRRRGVP
jgi:N-carbamoyl-L-amino-acid hydrolase